MIRRIHSLLHQNRTTRRLQRGVVGWVKDLVSCPDAYQVLKAVHRKVKPRAILDIGAHEGMTLVKLLDFVPNAKIHAIEPTPASVQALQRMASALPNVTVHEMAISDKTGTTTFFCNTGSMQNSLLDNAQAADSPFVDLQKHVGQISVKTMSLDDWADQFEPDGTLLIKADVQGAEEMLVAGGRRTFKNRVAAFYTEVCLLPQYEGQADFWALNRLLTQELGFALYEIYACGKDPLGRAAWTDVMWVKPEILPL